MMANRSFISQFNILLLVVFLSIACQSIVTDQQDKPLPVWVHKFFINCPQTLDGSVNLKLYKKQELIGNVDLDWVSNAQGDLKIQLYNNAGQTLLNINYDNNTKHIAFDGPIKKHLPNVFIDQARFIILQGNFTGINILELSCFLKFKYPFKWLEHYHYYIDDTSTAFKLYIKDHTGITKSLKINKNELYEVSSILVKMEWRKFFFYKNKLFININYTAKEFGEILGIKDYKIKWTNLDL